MIVIFMMGVHCEPLSVKLSTDFTALKEPFYRA